MKKTTILILLAIFCSCQTTENAPIEPKKLTLILTDMHTAEAAAEGEFMTVKDSILKIYYAQILKKHGVSQADFDSTLAVYSRQPVAFDSIYSSVLREIAKIDTTKH